jgi:hypothetical protein
MPDQSTEAKIAAAVARCREKAAACDSEASRETYLLYAELLPGIVRWEELPANKKMDAETYLSAVVGACVTLAAHGLRNATGDDPDLINQNGPLVTAQFSVGLHHEVFHGEIGAILGKTN